ncbi:MAG: EamA family transporter RarD [Sphingomonadaceae bacterium]|nr:EamA family transporter RarD [Sphingomonadaceae bacterium]
MNQSQPHPQVQPSGLPAALTAYFIWGFMPLYLLLVKSVPPPEFVGWRIIWTLPLCLVIVALRKQWPDLRRALADWRSLAFLTASAILIAINWLLYVWAIQSNQVYAASLGYYINPLVNVLLGTVVLGERLSRLQWAAVAIAALGIALLLGGALDALWISLTLAFSFGAYGLLRKQVPAGALPGLTIESAILLLPAAGIAMYYAAGPNGSAFFQSPELSLSIMLGGALTAFPLLLFAIAARRMDYSTLGFTQFLAPTIVFVLALTVFKQPLEPVKLACFILIWIAIGLFSWDLLQRRSKTA